MTVIGVMPAGFDFPRLADVLQIMNWAPEQAEFWTPFVITPQMVEKGNFNYHTLGRLRDVVNTARAAARMLPIAVHLFKEKEVKYPQYKGIIEQMLGSLIVYVTPLRDTMAWGIRDVFWMLLAAVALFLSALGLFGVASLSAARRTREFGIRLAVGATAGQIVRLELARTAIMVIAGLGFGVIASIAMARAMAGLLYRVTPWSTEIFLCAALVLIASALLAGWLPARRAARIDPATALRTE